MTAIFGSDVIPFLKGIDLTGAKDISQSGGQFSDVFQVLGRGAATGQSDISSGFGQLSNFIKNLFTSKSSLPNTDISGGQTGFPSQTVNQVQNIPRAISTFNPNIIAGSAAVGAGAIGSTLIFTNKDFNQSVQANAGALKDITSSLNDLTKSTSTFTDFITQNPIILIALIGFGVIVVLKK